MKRLMIALATTTALMASHVYAADEAAQVNSKVDYKKNGGYAADSKAEQKTVNGTTNKAEKNVDVDVDSDGKTDATVKNESSSDPKGLMNSKKNEQKSKYSDKSNGGYKKSTTSSHSDAAGTDSKVEKTTDVDVDSKGNTTSTVTTEKTTDPKGLMNKHTTKAKVKAVNGEVTEEKAN